jgi:hypothetical protein
MGASVEVDGAGEWVGGDTGNLLARFPFHTVNEWVDLRDLVLTAGLVLETVRLNAA